MIFNLALIKLGLPAPGSQPQQALDKCSCAHREGRTGEVARILGHSGHTVYGGMWVGLADADWATACVTVAQSK